MQVWIARRQELAEELPKFNDQLEDCKEKVAADLEEAASAQDNDLDLIQAIQDEQRAAGDAVPGTSPLESEGVGPERLPGPRSAAMLQTSLEFARSHETAVPLGRRFRLGALPREATGSATSMNPSSPTAGRHSRSSLVASFWAPATSSVWVLPVPMPKVRRCGHNFLQTTSFTGSAAKPRPAAPQGSAAKPGAAAQQGSTPPVHKEEEDFEGALQQAAEAEGNRPPMEPHDCEDYQAPAGLRVARMAASNAYWSFMKDLRVAEGKVSRAIDEALRPAVAA